MMIRPIQVDVAKQMMNMPDGKNGVMQLNMGEGKTSVIVPMLCATLANESTLCRVTVLNSIFKTNLKILSFAIGGLLNRRVYTVPCRRDMDIGSACLQRINDAYSECLKMNGVVLTRPEHRLSFRLKIYDQIVKGNVAHGLKFLDTENWVRKLARDILDESDELLSVKYQLVYTIGTQVPIDGGDLRWKTCQKILKMVAEIADDLYEKFGSSVLEYNPTEREESPEKFNHFRLLNNACRKEFYDRIANGFLQEIKLTSAQRASVKAFLTENNLDQATHASALAIFQENPDLLCKVLLVSGYIRRGILELALSKRWRVEYGVDPKGLRRMAVPFRAKDVAAERTEFGHPDLAIVLTHLSYYYSGLSDRELQECFDCLKTKLGPDMIYSSWIQTIPKEKVPKFLQTYQGVNSQDPFHRDHLYNMFRNHKLIIDFWLSEKVFPKESKQFPGKIVMTAWDLCYERNQHSVCGFSGTNDSSILLPLQISQQDLPVLLDTNRKLEQTLLQPENNNHGGFHMGVTCREILEAMKKDGLQVLIDSGAMMLQCDNEQVAKLWLEIDADIDAVVYFSRDNDMLVKCRGDSVRNVQDLPLELSPFRSRLGRCGVFLDDQHSRGTDLKFPSGLKACVTVGTRMRRDKLMQACMRMRKLGKGHSVTFYLSHEAYDKVMDMKEGQDQEDDESSTLETQDVINWVCQNTKEFNEDGILYWSLAGKNYAQKLAAEDTFHYLEHNIAGLSQVAKILGSQCVDDEVLLLLQMYGVFTESALLVSLIPGWFNLVKDKLVSKNGGRDLEEEVLKKFYSICDGIVQRCLTQVPNKMHITSMLEEEQEKELEKEVEVEEERQIERPTRAQEAIPQLHPNVRDTVENGIEIVQKAGI
ncbi:unnamed protein product [Orchesella dallaii]|uniref:ubiquitinyl hydrolase 1 n=1 Tax=Orchesella dallaii TaxID=48710 RepID=A0ABP1RFY8_9HEXA